MSVSVLSVWVDAFAGIGSLGAFAVAIWVFMDANRIKKVEQLALHYKMWADFHQIEIDTGFLDKWGEFYTLNFDEEKFLGREHVVTYAILNLLRVSWTMCQEKVLHTTAQQEEVFNYFYALRKKRAFLLRQIAAGGYDPSFYLLVADSTVEDRSKAYRAFEKSLSKRWVSTSKRARKFEFENAYGRSQVQTAPAAPASIAVSSPT